MDDTERRKGNTMQMHLHPRWYDSGYAEQVFALQTLGVDKFKLRNSRHTQLADCIPRRPRLGYRVQRYESSVLSDQRPLAGRAALIASVHFRMIVNSALIDLIMQRHFQQIIVHCKVHSEIIVPEPGIINIYQASLGYDVDTENLIARKLAGAVYDFELTHVEKEQLKFVADPHDPAIVFQEMFAVCFNYNPVGVERLSHQRGIGTQQAKRLSEIVREVMVRLEHAN